MEFEAQPVRDSEQPSDCDTSQHGERNTPLAPSSSPSDESKLYSLKWSSHTEQLLYHFDSLLQAECFVDVTLACDDATFKAHKVVLSACSSYLERLFTTHPSKHPLVVLQGISAWELRTLLEFMYRGEVQVEPGRIGELLRAANALQIRGLTDGSLYRKTEIDDSQLRFPRNTQDMPEIEFSLERTKELRPFQLPRRKQARPRRRSGDICGALDMSIKTERRSSPSPTPSVAIANTPTHCSSNSPENLPLGHSAPYSREPISPMSETNNNLLLKTTSLWSSVVNGTNSQGRRKGQHSAPRGGPPRAWTNTDLTDALNQVWNRKMTTSQASRVYGIPYNSLLMYVRGKYGKSLRLDALRKETLEGEAMAVAASTRGSGKGGVNKQLDSRECKIPRTDLSAFQNLTHLPPGFNYLNYLREFSFPLHLPIVSPVIMDEHKEIHNTSDYDGKIDSVLLNSNFIAKTEPNRSPIESPLIRQEEVDSHF